MKVLAEHFCWLIISADILKYFSHIFSRKKTDSSCKLSHRETIYMKCQSIFSKKKKKKKNIINLLSAKPALCSTQLSKNFVLLINLKLLTIANSFLRNIRGEFNKFVELGV